MNAPTDLRNLPWQAMQRRLAAAFAAEAPVYPPARSAALPHWRFAASAGSWLGRTRSGVIRARTAA